MNKYKQKIKDENLREIFSFLKLLSESGISLEESLFLMGNSLNKKSSLDLKSLTMFINEGKTMHKSLKLIGIDDKFVLSIVEIAEIAGKLPEAFGQLESYYDGKLETKSELVKAFAYPATVLVSIISLFFGILTYIVPKIVNDFFAEGDTLPFELDIVMKINNWLRGNLFFIFAFFSISVVCILIVKNNTTARSSVEKFFAESGILGGIGKKIYIKNFAWKISILLNSGMDIYRAIDVLRQMEKNLYYKGELEKFADMLRLGESITSAARATSICDQVVIAYIDKGSEIDKIADAFNNIWIVYDRYLKEYMKRLKTALQPITIMILGIIVALMAMLVMSITDVSNFVTEVN